jgi:hypothetical protein
VRIDHQLNQTIFVSKDSGNVLNKSVTSVHARTFYYGALGESDTLALDLKYFFFLLVSL